MGSLRNGEGIAKYKWLTWEGNLEYAMLVGHFEGKVRQTSMKKCGKGILGTRGRCRHELPG